jgi:DNA-binding PucR family transcriptional regulator
LTLNSSWCAAVPALPREYEERTSWHHHTASPLDDKEGSVTGTDQWRRRRAWVTRLVPQGEVNVGQAASPRPVVEDAVARVGVDPVRWVIELNSAVVRRIVNEVPALGGTPAAVEMLRRGNEMTTLRALFALAEGPTVALPVNEATSEDIREFVHRAVPLEQVLHGIRIGHAATTEAFLGACAELVEPELAVDEVTTISRELFTFVDELSDSMISAYLAEHEAWSASAAAALAEVVRSLLSDAASTDVGEASRVLRYDLRQTHEAVVVWSDSPNDNSKLQSAAIEVLRARGATTTLVIPVGSGRLWAWGTMPSSGAHRTGSWESIADALSRRHVQAAFGTSLDGVAGFRGSHHEAESAERVEQLRRAGGRSPRRVTAYAEVAVVALMSTDLNAARAFVRRELGVLADRSVSVETLRTTLYHYIAAERSLVDVARRLYVARGTVTYRVKRAESLLGHDLDDRRFAIFTALALAEELGDAVLLPHDVEP